MLIDPSEVSISPAFLVRGFGEEGSLVCEGFGIPPPALSWRREDGDDFSSERFLFQNSVRISQEGYEIYVSNLTLLNTQRNLEGTYICKGVNNVSNFIGVTNESEGMFFIEG